MNNSSNCLVFWLSFLWLNTCEMSCFPFPTINLYPKWLPLDLSESLPNRLDKGVILNIEYIFYNLVAAWFLKNLILHQEAWYSLNLKNISVSHYWFVHKNESIQIKTIQWFSGCQKLILIRFTCARAKWRVFVFFVFDFFLKQIRIHLKENWWTQKMYRDFISLMVGVLHSIHLGAIALFKKPWFHPEIIKPFNR